MENTDYCIRAREVAQRLSIGRSTLYDWIQKGYFPKPRRNQSTLSPFGKAGVTAGTWCYGLSYLFRNQSTRSAPIPNQVMMLPTYRYLLGICF